ncbi:nitrous oxide reductase accessory protein NosL [Aridibaculum aurantiacum]|uniref:nitrous oxide reductase accessory protein NosL n=1 Tax=Aridibaculum aurantiacum TaxID=2810307 RepID=UPI001A9586AE|nr:nitrous oxide reductase accessory protein NosL [Aridibaculum aurantiacum]
MKNNSNRWARILVASAAIILAGAIFLPIWRIELDAPQYPEGLTMLIYANGLAGDIDIINTLNHYIGMQHLDTSNFIEFTLLPYIISGLVLLAFVAALINNKKFYYMYIALFMLVAIVSMADFYRWEYNYGHNLDPNAAIQVPGMAYQPPLIGFKELLNFGAYSIPDIGGWLFIGAGLLLAAAFFLLVQPKWLPAKMQVVPAFVLLVMLQSCSTQPQAIKYGSDACEHCKMTIMDKRFGSEWVTTKGKVFRFDDLLCLQAYLNKSTAKGTVYIQDFSGKKELVKAEELLFVHGEELRSPMGGNTAAFTDKADAEKAAASNSSTILSWQEIEKR